MLRHSIATAFAVAAVGLAASAQAQEVVKIGYTGPLSGGAALYGKNVQLGLEMAIAEVNAKGLDVGGKKYKLELVSLDDKYSPAEAALNARRLAQEHKTPAVFIPHSGGIFAVQAFNQQENFLLMAYSSVPKITETGNKLTVRIPPSFAGYIEPFIKYEMGKYGKKVGLLPADHDYAKAWVSMFSPAWEKAGGTIVESNPMSYNKATDFYSGVSKVVAAKPDVMFIGGPSEPTALVAKQARELGFKGGFILMDQAKIDEMAKVTNGLGMLEGSIGTLPIVADERPGAKAFVERFRKAQGADKPVTSETVLNYSMVHAIAEAMKMAGTVSDPAAIRAKFSAALAALKDDVNPLDYNGLDDKGGTTGNVTVGVVEGGKIKPIRLADIK